MLTKLPLDIPKFEGNSGENLSTRITIYHLQCSFNSLADNLINIHLFQCTLTRDATKWYIELDTTSYGDFSSLVQTFLMHFELPMRYDINYDILSNFKQDDSMLISNHIHEWVHHKRLVRTKLLDEILHKWFVRSL